MSKYPEIEILGDTNYVLHILYIPLMSSESYIMNKLLPMLMVLSFMVNACGSPLPTPSDVADYLNSEADGAKTIHADEVKNLKCSSTGDGITSCEYSVGLARHQDVFKKGFFGSWYGVAKLVSENS